ncbi:hypothetical protein [Marinobacter zhanjiangensis]|uniref:hypothetical protein n=1 Tax=Marinobacter zhanjiangensis TaxID=578215 RepID=UPI0016771ACC|nr:hypothetical protein [Marinobacter zhanjiangensis]
MKKNAYSVSVHSGAKCTTNDHGNPVLHQKRALKTPLHVALPQRRAPSPSRKAVVALFWRASLKLASSLHLFPAADYQSDAAPYRSRRYR